MAGHQSTGGFELPGRSLEGPMRVTQRSQTLALQRYVSQNQERLSEAAIDISSGQSFSKASENPTATAKIQRVREISARFESYLAAGERMEGEFDAADSALSSANDILLRIRELAMQMGSGPKPTITFDGAEDLVEELKGAMVDIANTTFDDRYIFAGVNDQSQPYDAAGLFTGSTTVREVQVAEGSRVNGLSGEDIFGASAGEDIFTLFDDFSAALAAEDQNAILNLLDRIDASQDQVNSARTHYGNQTEAIFSARDFIESMLLVRTEQESALLDTDVVEAVSRLEAAKTELQASVQMSSEIEGLDILRYL